jgi:kumamolisin
VAPSTGLSAAHRRGRRLFVLTATTLVLVPGLWPAWSLDAGVRPLTAPSSGSGAVGGMRPEEILTTYNAGPLAATGKGQTIVFFERASFDPKNLAAYEQRMFPNRTGLPFAPQVIDGPFPPEDRDGEPETEMDLEVAHAVAPDAALVVVNAESTLVTDTANTYDNLATLFASVDRRYPGAVWSSSIWWGCDRFRGADHDHQGAITAALASVNSAVATAESHGSSAFDADGDTGGFGCKPAMGADRFYTAPDEAEKGLDSVASLPAMTDVGGTTVSTDAHGVWLAEEPWVLSPVSQGTGGGVSNLWQRPPWQHAVHSPADTAHRLTPDVSADADPTTGMAVCVAYDPTTSDTCWTVGGGTSQAAPIWAGLTALMNQYLIHHGGHALGDLNPQLYRVATATAARPAFHDVTVGGNAVNDAAPGYDLVAGLGTPNVDNLAHDLSDLQQGRGT